MDTILLYAGMLAARELTNMIQGNPLGVTLCELRDGKPDFVCTEGIPTLLKQFEENSGNAESSCLVHHGLVTFSDGEKCAAIIMRASASNAKPNSFVVGLPYRDPKHSKGFAIYGPLPLSDEPTGEILADWIDRLFEGFETENPELWEKYGDELPE